MTGGTAMSGGDWRAARARYWVELPGADADSTVIWLRDAGAELAAAGAERPGPVASGARLGPGLGLHHDGAADSVLLGFGPPDGQAGLGLTTTDFRGTYVSVTIDCLRGGEPMSRASILALWAAFAPDRMAPAVRLNLEAGVNLERPAPLHSRLPEGVLVEFDLGELPPAEISGGWFDVIFPPVAHLAWRLSALRILHRRRADF